MAVRLERNRDMPFTNARDLRQHVAVRVKADVPHRLKGAIRLTHVRLHLLILTPRAAGPVGIMHGDYSLFNVMFADRSPAHLAAIIDWDTATIGVAARLTDGHPG